MAVSVLGLAPSDLVSFARAQRGLKPQPRPIAVSGILAGELAAVLSAGCRSSLVRVGEAVDVSALVRVLGGAPTAEDLRVLRAAARRGLPVIAVQTGEYEGRIPYVPATDVIQVPTGKGFPVEQIAAALARVLVADAIGLALDLPVLAAAARRARVRRAALQAAAYAASSPAAGHDLPRLSRLQAVLLADLRRLGGDRRELSDPAELAAAVAPELGAGVCAGLACRALVRTLPWRGRVIRAAVAGGATLALGEVALRVRKGQTT